MVGIQLTKFLIQQAPLVMEAEQEKQLWVILHSTYHPSFPQKYVHKSHPALFFKSVGKVFSPRTLIES